MIQRGRPRPAHQTAGHSLGITGGHCDDERIQPRACSTATRRAGIADGADRVRAAVRYQVKYGADVIKTCATGGVLSEGDAVGVQQYDDEELKAMVERPPKLERKVAAHAHGAEGIKVAPRAGVASIEHGSISDDEATRCSSRRKRPSCRRSWRCCVVYFISCVAMGTSSFSPA